MTAMAAGEVKCFTNSLACRGSLALPPTAAANERRAGIAHGAEASRVGYALPRPLAAKLDGTSVAVEIVGKGRRDKRNPPYQAGRTASAATDD